MRSDWYNFREMELSDLSGCDVVVKMLLLKQLCLCLHGAGYDALMGCCKICLMLNNQQNSLKRQRETLTFCLIVLFQDVGDWTGTLVT